MAGHSTLDSSFYDVTRYPAAGKCLQKARYPAVRNFDQFSRNNSVTTTTNELISKLRNNWFARPQ